MVGHKDWWIERFLLDTNNREDEALDRLVSTMKWRKQSGVNQLTARSFPAEMYRIGGLVRFCRDRNDRPVLWIQTFRHRPCSQWSALAKQFIVYQLELIDRESISHSGWSMIADTSQLSMANMDIGYSNFMINCLQQHYPGGVRYLLNIDLPWYMNLAVAVIIGFMDQHLRSIYRSVTSEELTDYLSADSIPVRLGGNYNRSLITVPDGVQTLADGFGHMFTRKQIADIQETFVDELNESN
ncbi:motile sperm domain-containing protein 2-like [Oppia nitens]|uniref:motile sperm domain-containing protein 2-like n=1 Tax=Oppia nitens TaxID=1686743 RepID=UPI0023DCAAB0|nr:motile sperm domain-containing protein 2-like [Oppia nitens]